MRQRRVWPILLGVGLLCLSATAWLSREMSESGRERLEQRFLVAARARADLVSDRMRAQIGQLSILQRFFSSVGEVDWPAFEKFAEPMVSHQGVRGFGWVPVLEARDRARFERAGRQIWGDDFAISERDADGNAAPVATRARYFPVLYAVPLGRHRKAIGLNLHATGKRGPVIDQAVDTNQPTASAVSHLTIDRQQSDTLVIVAPVYRGRSVPPTREARRAEVRGVVLAVLSIGALFDAVNAGAPQAGLYTRLFDHTEPQKSQLIRSWGLPLAEVEGATPGLPPIHVQEFELAGRRWSVQVAASAEWLQANASRSPPFIPYVGTLLTLLLLLYLRAVLSRRAKAEALVARRSDDLVERQLAYATLVEHLPAIICRYDSLDRHIFCNAAFERLLGAPFASVAGRTLREVFECHPAIDPALIAQWEAALRTAFASGQAQHLAFGFPGGDGPRFFEGVLVPEASTEGVAGTVLGIFHDITERQAAEAWARKLSLAVEQNPASIVITDTAGRIEYVNQKFVETTGYQRTEAIGQNPRILKSGSTSETTYQELWATIEAGRSWHGEFQNRRRDGTLYWERALIAPLQDSHGQIMNYVAIKEDISELRETIDRLHESEGRFRGVVAAMAEGLIVLSADGVVVFANRAAEEILGMAQQPLQGVSLCDAPLDRVQEDGTPFPPQDYPATIAVQQGREVRNVVMGVHPPGGCLRWILINASPLGGAGEPRPGAAVLTFTDISARRQVEEQLQLAFEVINHSGEGIMVTDAERRIILVNAAFEGLTGYRAEEALGQTPRMLSSGRHGDEFYRAMRDSLESTAYWQGEIWNRRKNGQIYPEWLGISAVRQSAGRPQHYIGIFSDISERKAAQEHIEFLAHHDALTQLPNRLLLRDRLEQAMVLAARMQSRVAVLFLDLDRFKTINDSLGHPVGDALLKAVVGRLKACLRESDTISRQGGDEFVIVLNDVRDGEAISRLVEKIQQQMIEPFIVESHALSTAFSIGVALYPDDGEDFDTLTRKADTAMYHAKHAGRNTHRFFTEQMNLQAVEHLHLETRLRLALERGEFVLYYQPQLDFATGRVVGVEALIRWVSPQDGLVSPARFIPIAEESGLIVPIGSWVLNEACRQARAWQDAGLPPFVVAVNLSALQFRRQDLVNTVVNALVLADLDAQWLELELTESILIQDAEATLDTVRRLKAVGVKLSVDDFGTGYSSLAYLKRFAVDKLKIDQSFVRDLATDTDDAAIVRAIIQMAHSLKLRTIAEGVESVELAEQLRAFHCNEIQGYWFARPMPAADLGVFVRARLGV